MFSLLRCPLHAPDTQNMPNVVCFWCLALPLRLEDQNTPRKTMFWVLGTSPPFPFILNTRNTPTETRLCGACFWCLTRPLPFPLVSNTHTHPVGCVWVFGASSPLPLCFGCPRCPFPLPLVSNTRTHTVGVFWCSAHPLPFSFITNTRNMPLWACLGCSAHLNASNTKDSVSFAFDAFPLFLSISNTRNVCVFGVWRLPQPYFPF